MAVFPSTYELSDKLGFDLDQRNICANINELGSACLSNTAISRPQIGLESAPQVSMEARLSRSVLCRQISEWMLVTWKFYDPARHSLARRICNIPMQTTIL